jgi:hypothetical protein
MTLVFQAPAAVVAVGVLALVVLTLAVAAALVYWVKALVAQVEPAHIKDRVVLVAFLLLLHTMYPMAGHMVAGALVLELQEELQQVAQSVSSGPEQLAHSHQQIQAIFNLEIT